MERLTELEELLCNFKSCDLDDVKNIIEEQYSDLKDDIFFFLINLISIRPFLIEEILRIVKDIVSENTKDRYIHIMNLLLTNQIIASNNFKNEFIPEKFDDIIFPFQKGSPERAIIDDDLSSFISFLAERNDFSFKVMQQVESALQLSAHNGSATIFKYLILNGHIIDEKCPYLAIIGGNREIIEILVEKGSSFHGEILLKAAIKFHRNDIASWIMSQYPQSCFKHISSFCIEHRNFSFFSENGYSLFEKDEAGRNALMLASEINSIELCNIILKENKAIINDYDKLGFTALMIACKNGNLSLVKFLVENGADVNFSPPIGFMSTVFENALPEEISNLTRYVNSRGFLYESLCYKGSTALLCATNGGHYKICKYLLEHGSDVNASDSQNNTCLINASFYNHIELCKLFIEHNANLDSQDITGSTALHYAAKGNFVEIGKLLVLSGANTLVTDNHNDIPITVAARSESKEFSTEICKLILEIRNKHS